jgi:hypothetical protein
MPKEVPKCEIERIALDEEYYQNLRAFLEDYGLSCLEAQIIYEVHVYPEHHVDIETLEKRKIPKELLAEGNVENSVKHLIENYFLKPYESKKQAMCVRCDDMGYLVAEEIQNRCYSKALKHYPEMKAKFENLANHRCDDLEHFEEGEERSIRLGNFNLKVRIEKTLTADIVVGSSEDGAPIHGRRVIAKIRECPRCREDIPIDFTYDTVNLYTESIAVVCQKCGFKFMLGLCLKWAFVP